MAARKIPNQRLDAEQRGRLRARLLKFAVARISFSGHEARQHLREVQGQYSSPIETNLALAEFVARGLLSELPPRRTGRPGRRPSEVYRVEKARLERLLEAEAQQGAA